MKYLLKIFLFVLMSLHVFAQQAKQKFAVILQSKDLVVSIDRATGLPIRYKYKCAYIRAADSLQKINVIVCRLHPRNYTTVTLSPVSVKSTQKDADFLFEANSGNQPTSSFHIKYSLDNSSVTITMEQVHEENGFELIEAALPQLATVREEDGRAWMANAIDGGSVVNLKDANEYTMPENDFFGNIGYVLPVAIAGTDKAECVMEVAGFMDGTIVNITGRKGQRHAHLGMVQTYRVHGGRSYEMGDGGPRVAGNEHTPNLIVGQTSRCRLDFTADDDGNGSVDWLDGAKIVARRMPSIPTKYFNDKFVYLVGGKYKPEKEPRTTFAQSETLVHDIAMLTDFAPQVTFISGWVYDGQDTGFPSEDSVNGSLGGYEGLVKLIKAGKNFNANVTVNTNYDDAYKSSPVFDTNFLARRPDGKIWQGRDWAGDTSYIVALAKYMRDYGTKRMDFSINRYGLKNTVLVDALSWFAIRNNWDPAHPASGYKNLVEGRFTIIDEFAKRGIQVASEQLRYPYIGKLALLADGSGNGNCPFGGESIPFVATIYRKSAIWGSGGSSSENVAKNLFWNCRPMLWYVSKTNRSAIADYYYLTVLPYNQIHDLPVESYRRAGYTTDIGLGKASNLKFDWFNNNYSVIKDGAEIAANDATFCRLDEDRVAFYSRSQKELKAVLPAGWNAATIVAYAMYTDHREVFPVKAEQGKIVVSAKARLPVIVYRDAAASSKKHRLE